LFLILIAIHDLTHKKNTKYIHTQLRPRTYIYKMDEDTSKIIQDLSLFEVTPGSNNKMHSNSNTTSKHANIKHHSASGSGSYGPVRNPFKMTSQPNYQQHRKPSVESTGSSSDLPPPPEEMLDPIYANLSYLMQPPPPPPPYEGVHHVQQSRGSPIYENLDNVRRFTPQLQQHQQQLPQNYIRSPSPPDVAASPHIYTDVSVNSHSHPQISPGSTSTSNSEICRIPLQQQPTHILNQNQYFKPIQHNQSTSSNHEEDEVRSYKSKGHHDSLVSNASSSAGSRKLLPSITLRKTDVSLVRRYTCFLMHG